MQAVKFVFILFIASFIPCLQAASFNEYVIVGNYSDHVHTHPMILQSHTQGNQWSFIHDIAGIPSLLKPLYATKIYCDLDVCIVVGGGIQSDSTIPYIVIGDPQGSAWRFPTAINDIPENAFEIKLNLISCQNGNCVAGGSYHQYASCNYPLFLTSQDKGNHWSLVNISNLPYIKNDCVYPEAMTCQEQTCIAVGKHSKPFTWMSNDPLLLTSQNSGKNWSYLGNTRIRDLPLTIKNSDTHDVACEKNTCLVAGSYKKNDGTDYRYPMILISKDEGRTWAFLKNLPSIPVGQRAELQKISCYENHCAAAGIVAQEKSSLLLLVSHDLGKSWSLVKTLTAWPTDAKLKSIVSLTCFEKGCILTGALHDTSDHAEPYDSRGFFLVTKSNASEWTFTQRVSGLPLTNSNISLYQTQCMKEVCYSVGAYDKGYSYYPLILKSIDGGYTWDAITEIEQLPSDFIKGVLYDI
jgi:hypothetical protein